MKKYLMKIYMITLMIISFGVINDSHVYAEMETLKNEGTFNIHVPIKSIYDVEIYGKNAIVWKEYTVDKSGIYEISLDIPSQMYDINVHEINEGSYDKYIDIEVDYKKRLKVYFDRNKKYKLRFYFIGCSSEEFEFDFISRLSDGSSTDSTNEGSSYEYEEKTFQNEGLFEAHIPKENLMDFDDGSRYFTIYSLYYKTNETGIYRVLGETARYVHIYSIDKGGEEHLFVQDKFKGLGTALDAYFEKNKTYRIEIDKRSDVREDLDISLLIKVHYKKKFSPQATVELGRRRRNHNYINDSNYKYYDESDNGTIKGFSVDYETNTITLKNCTLNKNIYISYGNYGLDYDPCILVTPKINLIGSNKMTYMESAVIEVENGLEFSIEGKGTLNVSAPKFEIYGSKLNINDISINAQNMSIVANDLNMNNAKINTSINYKKEKFLDESEYLEIKKIRYDFIKVANKATLNNCKLNLRYNLLPTKYLKNPAKNVVFMELDKSSFDNCKCKIEINKQLLKKYKKYINKNGFAKTSKFKYKKIDKSYRNGLSKGTKFAGRGKNLYYCCKVVKPASTDGKQIGEVVVCKGFEFFYCVDGVLRNLDSITYCGNKYKIVGFERKALLDVRVDYYSLGKYVKDIGAYAFSRNENLKTVVINGNKLTKIGKGAFSKNTNLKYVKIKSKKLVKIGKGAFAGSKKKIKFVVPKKMVKKYKKALKKAGVENFVVKGF